MLWDCSGTTHFVKKENISENITFDFVEVTVKIGNLKHWTSFKSIKATSLRELRLIALTLTKLPKL